MRQLYPSFKNYFFTFLLIITCHHTYTQSVGINSDGSPPDASAMLDVQSNNSGVLIPRLTTTQRTGIGTPATGLVVFDIDTKSFWFYAGSSWVEVQSGFVTMISDDDNDTKGRGFFNSHHTANHEHVGKRQGRSRIEKGRCGT